MNRGALKLRVSRMLGIALGAGDDAADEDALLDELANEAVVDILSRTRAHVRRLDLTLDVGATQFDLDQAILRLYSVERGDGNFLTEQTGASVESGGYAVVGLNRLVFGTAGSGSTDIVTVYWTPRPTPMTDDSHDPADVTYGRIPPEHHRAILDYMMWHAADKSGDGQTGRGERYRVRYEGQDGLGGPGSDLGRIKVATNMLGGGSIVRQPRPVLASDRDASYYQG